MYGTKALLFIAAFAGISQSQKSDAEFCSSQMSSFFTWAAQGPTTPAAVLAFLATKTSSQPPLATFDPEGHQEEICSIYEALPATLLPEFETYIVSVLSFGNAHSTVLLNLATNCVPEERVASVTSYIHAMLTPTGNPCDATPAPCSAVNGTYPTSPAPTATSSFSTPGNYTHTTSIVTAAAARPTGAMLGAAAIGGVLGAAVML
ncbi:hypothetical protein SAMD00023353_5500520 [Rosellinia necatrix]|uniref:Infection structure specific protein n=1 Tax=Rosellinia necatrix TaxID=77044 RepID=A0A1W2TQX6_ROSNE|nr:hypothetical protein SAMD00023353_5500520 [Rosellinia necatrix]